MSAAGPEVVGRPVSDEELKQLADLQAIFKPAEALNRVDEFAKWIFSSVAVVGTLGVGFSAFAFPKLVGAGQVFMALAILLTGISLFSSVLALRPQWIPANLSSRTALINAVNLNLHRRRLPLQVAAALFGLSLVLAAAAPLVSVIVRPLGPQHVMLAYEWKADGKLSGQLTGVGLEPYSPVEVGVETSSPVPVEQLRVRKIADATGKAEANVELPNPFPAGTPLNLTGQWADAAGPGAPLVHKQVLQVLVPPRPQEVSLSYEWKSDGKLSAHLTGVGLKPYMPAEISVETSASPPLELIRARQIADVNGKVEAGVELGVPFLPKAALRLAGQWPDSAHPNGPLTNKRELILSVPAQDRPQPPRSK